MSEHCVFPTITTSRLQLRKILASDMPAIFHGLSDPRVSGFYGISYDTLESTQAQMDWYELIARTGIGLWWGICHVDAPEQLIGTCGLYDWEQEHHCAELGFWLAPEHWGQGLMRESLTAMLAHAYAQLSLHRIQARAEPANTTSWHLLEQLGFRLEGILRECEYKNGQYVDLKCYSRLASDPFNGCFQHQSTCFR